MAETNRPLLTDRDADIGRYQPLSILAIFALAVVGVFTVMVVGLTAAGLYTRKPILEPILILVDVAGLALAFVARWQILGSEGTRAGLKLTKWAIVLGIGFGGVYIAYYFGNLMAVRQQANEFAGKWMDLLKERNFTEAFFYTIPPAQRQNRKPEDITIMYGDSAGSLQNQEMVRLFERAKKGEAHVESQGVFDWKETVEGLVVTLNFLLRTREGEFDLTLTVIGTESSELDGRQWQVRAGMQNVKLRRLTAYGKLVYELHIIAHKFMQDWHQEKLLGDRRYDMYLDTQDITTQERHDRLTKEFLRVNIAPLLATLYNPSRGVPIAIGLPTCIDQRLLAQVAIPEVEKMHLQLVEFKDSPLAQVPKAIKDEISPRIIRPITMQAAMVSPVPDVIPIRVVIQPDAIRAYQPLDFVLPTPLSYRSRGMLICVCTDKATVDKANELANASYDPNAPTVEDKDPSVLSTLRPDWRIEKIIVGTEQNKSDPRPGGATPSGPQSGPPPRRS